MNLSTLKKVPSNRENVDNFNEPFPVSRSKVSHRLEAVHSLQISFICVLMENVSDCRVCVLFRNSADSFIFLPAPKICCILRALFHALLAGVLPKRNFSLVTHLIDLTDQTDQTGAASRPLQGFSLSRFSFSSAPSSESACNSVFHLPCRLQTVTA